MVPRPVGYDPQRSLKTVGTASSVILALAMYPQLQKQAQQEIESVVGSGHLPDFEDLSQLHYLHAFIKEVVRMWPVTPVGKLYLPLRRPEFSTLNHSPSSRIQ